VIDTAILTSLSGLLGAFLGGSASLVAAVYTQRAQNRIQRVAAEAAKRETVYADFVAIASNLTLTAYTTTGIMAGGEEQRLVGLINRMRLFAPPEVILQAELVLKDIVEIALKPRIELQLLAKEALSKVLEPDPLLRFSMVCRKDIDNVLQTF